MQGSQPFPEGSISSRAEQTLFCAWILLWLFHQSFSTGKGKLMMGNGFDSVTCQ